MALFFFTITATTAIYTLSLHDALPILIGLLEASSRYDASRAVDFSSYANSRITGEIQDRKSTRLNSSHQIISYAVFCLKKKSSDDQTRERRCSWRTDELPDRWPGQPIA